MPRLRVNSAACIIACLVFSGYITGCIIGKEYWGLHDLSKDEQMFFRLSQVEQVAVFSQMPVEQQVDLLVKYFPRSHHGNYGLSMEVAKRKAEALPFIADALERTGSLKRGSHRARLGLLAALTEMLYVVKFDCRNDEKVMNALKKISAEEGVDSYVYEAIQELINAPSSP